MLALLLHSVQRMQHLARKDVPRSLYRSGTCGLPPAVHDRRTSGSEPMSTSWYQASASRLGGKQALIGLDILPMALNSGGPAVNRHRCLVEMVRENSLLEP